MFCSKPILVLISLVAVNVLATPHSLNHALHHRAIAARVASPHTPVSQNGTIPLRKRQNNQRCRQRPVSSSSSPSSSPVTPSSSSVTHSSTPAQVQPTHTTIQQQQAPPVAVPTPSPTTVQQPKPQPTTAPSSGNGPSYLFGPQSGDGTFYATGLGACGITNSDSDFIAAVSHLLFDTYPGYNGVNPNSNPVCGKKVTATYQGKSVTITVTDRCTGCALTDLDFSPSAFDQLALPAVGRIVGMVWNWV